MRDPGVTVWIAELIVLIAPSAVAAVLTVEPLLPNRPATETVATEMVMKLEDRVPTRNLTLLRNEPDSRVWPA